MGCSMLGFSVLHCLLEFVQTHIHWVSDVIQPSHPLSLPFPLTLSLSQHQGLFWCSGRALFQSRLFTSGGQSIGAWASASVLPMNIQDWFPLGLSGLISLQSKGLSRVFSSTTVKCISFLVLSLLYGSTLTSAHDYWKNCIFDYTELCWQSGVSSF